VTEPLRNKAGIFPDSLIIENGRSLEIFKEFVGNKNATILDVGCGNGAFLKSLTDSGYTNLSATDLENNLALAPLPRERFMQVDLSYDKLPVSEASFDAITAWEVVEHLENPYNFIREAHRTLKPRGHLIISIPNPFHLMSRLLFLKRGNMPRWTKRNNHITLFTKDIIWKAFMRDYFDLIDTRYHYGEFTYSFFKFFDGKYPENELFGHFLILVMRKKDV
jgi:2-polyprenyl-3-methyl-5-hydroxy-6-metoxy-1,4-benzoquinol methylase